VLTVIHQDVDEREAHLAWRAERSGVVSVPPDGAATAEGAVDRPRDADREAAEAVLERPGVVGLDDEMEMVVLNAELEKPEAAAGRRGESTSHRRKDSEGAEAVHSLRGPEGHMDRMSGGMGRAGTMGHATAAARRGFAAGTGAAAAPGAGRGQGELQGPRHLDSAIIAD
jgi:hypothetical protein